MSNSMISNGLMQYLCSDQIFVHKNVLCCTLCTQTLNPSSAPDLRGEKSWKNVMKM